MADGPGVPGLPIARRDNDVVVHWLTVGACCLVAVVGAVSYYLSVGEAKGRIWEATIVVLLALMVSGILRFQDGGRLPWIAIWMGLTSAFTGGFLAAHPAGIPFDLSSPSIVDALRLANYPLGAAGVLLLLFRTDRRIGTRSLLEALIATSAGSLLVWVLVIGPLIDDSERLDASVVVSLLYPFADILLLSVLAVLMVHLSGSPGSLVLVALALAGNLAADIAFSYQNLHGGYEAGGWIDVGWLLCFASLALAPSWPMDTPRQPVGDDGRLDGGRLVFLAVGALLAPGIALAQVAKGDVVDTEVLVAVAGLFGLVLARMLMFNRDLEASRSDVVQQADRLERVNGDLERARSDQRRLLDRMHRAVEEERTRLAAELHDRPLQHLAGIGYQLERVSVVLARGEHEAAASLCDRAAAALADQLGELRVLMTDIRPPVLDERGLVGALRDQAARIQHDHPELEVSVDGGPERPDRDVETALYRVAQEALQNVIRHANATAVWITVSKTEEQVILSISDNGRGMGETSKTDLLRSGRFGVAGMSERVELLGGSMTVGSRSPSGTTLSFLLPSTPQLTTPASLLETAP